MKIYDNASPTGRYVGPGGEPRYLPRPKDHEDSTLRLHPQISERMCGEYLGTLTEWMYERHLEGLEAYMGWRRERGLPTYVKVVRGGRPA